MSETRSEVTHVVSEGGVAARHTPVTELPVLVGPATGKEHNTITVRNIAIACWRVDDIRFEFDSSAVKPDIRAELGHLADLVAQHRPASKAAGEPGCPLSVFGHADPTGDDDYNKQLSGRRATAMYALLTRDPGLWEKLYSQPLGNDKWGRNALLSMLRFVSADGQATDEQASAHERDAGKRKQLFLQYMDKLCGSDLKLEKGDFLARGEDAGGKGDYQGCSEFNPDLILSEEQQAAFSKSTSKADRDAANAPNRRVVVLIFRKGSRVDPAKWPCPRVNEGVAGCKKRFWSDGEKRRTTRLPDEPRKFEKTKDTFACRFYDRLANGSPCEKGGRVRVLLDDPFLGFLAAVRVQATYADGSREGLITDSGGVVNVLADRGNYVDLEFTTALREHTLRVFVFPPPSSTREGAWQRLVNLGHAQEPAPPEAPPTETALELAVSEFQAAHGITPTGALDDATRAELDKVYDASIPWSEEERELLADDKFNESASLRKDALA